MSFSTPSHSSVQTTTMSFAQSAAMPFGTPRTSPFGVFGTPNLQQGFDSAPSYNNQQQKKEYYKTIHRSDGLHLIQDILGNVSVLYGDTRKQPTAVKFIQDDQRELTTELIPKVKGVAFIRGGRVQILTMKDGNTLVEETAPLADNAQSVIIDQILPVVTTEDFSFDPETTIDAIEHATTVIANRVQICATEVTESIEKNLERIDSFKSSLEALRSSLDTLNSLSTILHDVSLQQYLKGEGPNREVMDSLQKVNTFTQQLNTINSSLADINRVTAKIPTLTTSIDKLCDGIDELESQF